MQLASAVSDTDAEISETISDLNNQSLSGNHPETSYDGSDPVFRLLRLETGGSALMNLGYFGLRGPFGVLNMVKSLGKAQRRLVMESARRLQVGERHQVLDVACGRGESSYILQCLHPAATVFGLDRIERHVEVARTLFGHVRNLSYVTGDAMNLDFPDRSFDRVLCLEAAFHFHDRRAFLREAFRVLRPGGRLIVVDFAWNSESDRSHRNDPALRLVRRIWQWDDFYSLAEYRRTAAGSGFENGSHRDWTSRVTAPITAQMRCVSALGATRWGRALLCWKNPLYRSFTREDWEACGRAAAAHQEIQRRSRYMAFAFEKPCGN